MKTILISLISIFTALGINYYIHSQPMSDSNLMDVFLMTMVAYIIAVVTMAYAPYLEDDDEANPDILLDEELPKDEKKRD
jgi:hypothetical protein